MWTVVEKLTEHQSCRIQEQCENLFWLLLWVEENELILTGGRMRAVPVKYSVLKVLNLNFDMNENCWPDVKWKYEQKLWKHKFESSSTSKSSRRGLFKEGFVPIYVFWPWGSKIMIIFCLSANNQRIQYFSILNADDTIQIFTLHGYL